jgi:hypothetical protein
MDMGHIKFTDNKGHCILISRLAPEKLLCEPIVFIFSVMIEPLSQDADALVEIGNTIAPGMKAEITSLAVKSGVNFLGRTGLSNFTCTNYISCMHDDLDFSLEDFLKR